MATTRPPATWDAVVDALDAADHRSSRRIHDDAWRAAGNLEDRLRVGCDPLERRRLAALAARDALAAYRLAGGTPEHLAAAAGLVRVIGCGDDVAGSLGDRARVARRRIDLHHDCHRRRIQGDPLDDAAVEQRAAALERPRSAGRRSGQSPHDDADTDSDAAFVADIRTRADEGATDADGDAGT